MLVVGGSLAGMAAAARLAKAGHAVQLWEAADRLGGHLAATTGPGEMPVDAAPAILGFPAPWRDLFRKSGRTLEAELARTKAELVPASPATYEFADHSTLELPSDRGEQYVTLAAAYGMPVAGRWRDLLDWLDDVWQAIRLLGLERELTEKSQLSRPVRHLLRPELSVADLADRFDHPCLSAILRSTAWRTGSRPEHTPGWAAVGLSVERRFGRWTVQAPEADAGWRTGRTSTLVEALAARLTTRRVDVRYGRRVTAIRREDGGLVVQAQDGTTDRPGAVIFAADPWQLPDLIRWPALRKTRRDLRHVSPALAPQISHRLVAAATTAVSENVRLTAAGVPVVRYRRPAPGGSVESSHDYAAARPDPATGVAWAGFRSWFRRPGIRTELPGLLFAGPHTAAGNALSTTVLAGALASYAAHET